MKKSLFVFALLIVSAQLLAQKNTQKNPAPIKVPFNAASWTSKNNAIKFADHNGVPSLEITSNGETATLNNINFANGTIEFDMEFMGGFTSFYFHRQSDDESEIFYLRDRGGDPTATDGIQYAPVIKKVNMWDMYPQYQTAANFKTGEWTHIKLVMSGVQMLVYVNDKNPTLVVPHLEGNTKDGGIAFSGKCFVSNLVIKPNEVEGLSPMGEFDPVYNDNRYISSWHVSEPIDFASGHEPTNVNLPDLSTKWQKITAERNGLINVTRWYGQSTSRRMVWLRTTLKSKGEKHVKFNLGFSDEVWVFVNASTTYADKNLYAQGMRKTPEGRIAVENSSFDVTLRDGSNDILIGLTNDFYGWGIIARLENRIGVEYVDYVPEVLNKEFEPYFGVYASKDVPFKLKISQLENKLSLQATGEGPVTLDKSGDKVFTIERYNVILEFNAAEKKMTFKQGTNVYAFTKE